MKYLLGKTIISGRQFTYNDVVEKVATGFSQDYYGGNVQYFGRTKEGFLLCIRKNKAEILDIYVDEDLLTAEGLKLLLGKEETLGEVTDEKLNAAIEELKTQTETAERIALIEQAKALGVKGVLQNMKDETLIAKINKAIEAAKE
jgi:hypothetical protein